jgi:hypothetical protein
MNKGFDTDHAFKLAINPSPAFKAVSNNDLATLDKISMDIEQSIRRKTMKISKGKKPEMGGKENENSNNFMKNQTTFLRDDLSSEDEQDNQLTTSINPRPPIKGPKVTNSISKKRKRVGEKTVVEIKPYKVEQMIQTMERCPDLGKMLVSKYLIVILGSTSSQNLEKKMKS